MGIFSKFSFKRTFSSDFQRDVSRKITINGRDIVNTVEDEIDGIDTGDLVTGGRRFVSDIRSRFFRNTNEETTDDNTTEVVTQEVVEVEPLPPTVEEPVLNTTSFVLPEINLPTTDSRGLTTMSEDLEIVPITTNLTTQPGLISGDGVELITWGNSDNVNVEAISRPGFASVSGRLSDSVNNGDSESVSSSGVFARVTSGPSTNQEDPEPEVSITEIETNESVIPGVSSSASSRSFSFTGNRDDLSDLGRDIDNDSLVIDSDSLLNGINTVDLPVVNLDDINGINLEDIEVIDPTDTLTTDVPSLEIDPNTFVQVDVPIST
ncbi:MAG: hypothetical protein QNJ31_07585 [Candidatus Caenarcaniphilales bacterium]|nr:hypothetical protein [Candidatus Caenarcaniphilales bacterium]